MMSPSLIPPNTALAAPDTAELETTLGEVEQQLGALGNALKLHDAGAAELAASRLHRALALAVDHFARVARLQGGVPPALRRRLARTSGLVAAQRDAVARATTALDRAMEVLLPPAAAGQEIYGASGAAARSSARVKGSGLAQA